MTAVAMREEHVPVLCREAIERLAPRSGGVYVDATFGAGGHSRALLESAPGARLIALDADPGVEPSFSAPGLTFAHADFRTLREVLTHFGVLQVDGILFDFGISSVQLDDHRRGFSVAAPFPVDMRIDRSRGPSALDLLRTAGEAELAEIFRRYGEERRSRRIARAIVARRDENKLPRTAEELAALISGVLHERGKRERIHPATRAFQGLRIAVNDELAAIDEGLAAAVDVLAAEGRIVAISFHSLEDRLVKQRFRTDSRLVELTKKPLLPGPDEIAANPRARSAKLRAAARAR
jgi:16S rRNA (cytosine1402-N4)-methyltransferase